MEIMGNFYFLERDRTILFNTKQLRSEKQSFQHRELQQHNHKLFFVKKSAFNKKYKIYNLELTVVKTLILIFFI